MFDLGGAIEGILGAQTAAEAFESFCLDTRRLGYNHACLTLITEHPSVGLTQFHGFATDYPEDWMKYYMAEGYFAVDPVIHSCLSGRLPFFWDDAVAKQKRDAGLSEALLNTSRQLMHQAADAGLASGIGIPLVSRAGEVAAVGVSREMKSEASSFQELAEVNLMAGAFYERFMSFYSAENAVSYTPREVDVLSWSAEGKTDQDIATILGISTATVRYHWANIFTKMNVANKIQATCQAVRLGVIAVQRFKA
ncbi:autoinducer binding domain-containing protein [Roseibium sp. CAU 1637]|uniref:Autoinducer binding domain-containing protein n=1 Tax=Roseibium limicola TaxID=2816037 RepID=A0A939EQW3_9HYPH|nr:autoinducer binding domain-containing protein [Roseibium limicola]